MSVRILPLLLGTGLACLVVSGCVAPPASPPPAPAPAPAPAPPPPPAPAPTPAPPPAPPAFAGHWSDAPLTPGDWRYTASTASFGEPGRPVFSLRCDRLRGAVAIARAGTAPDPLAMTIRTESVDRALQTLVAGNELVATVSAGDAILDAMAFSKGRFAVEIPGQPTLYLPAWPEVIRVIEDCR